MKLFQNELENHKQEELLNEYLILLGHLPTLAAPGTYAINANPLSDQLTTIRIQTEDAVEAIFS